MGLIKKLLKLKFYVALVGAGYLLHSCVSNDYRYRIRRVDGTPYLVDTGMNQSLEIKTQTFQVGTTEYRLRGLLLEPDLQFHVEQLQHQLGVKKHELR